MDIPSIKNRYYSCEKCNKDYASYKSLWNHNKKFHDNSINQNQLLSTINQPNINQNQLLSININQNQLLNGKYNCRYCSKSYDIIVPDVESINLVSQDIYDTHDIIITYQDLKRPSTMSKY